VIVLFDLLGTLLSLDGLDAVVGGRTARELWIAETARDAMALTLAGRYTPFAAVGEAAWRRLLRDRPDADAAAAGAMAALAVLDARPGAAECVQSLVDRGHRLAALTNASRETGEGWLHAVQLQDRVTPVLSADAVGAAKPHPSPYRNALIELGSLPRHTCLVSVHAWDVVGAAAVGLATVWVGDAEGRWPFPGTPPDRVARGLDEVPDLLADAEGTPHHDLHARNVEGLDAIVDALRAEDFPMDREGVFYSVGDLEIGDRYGRRFVVRRLLDGIEQASFATAEDLARVLRAALRSELDRLEADLR
jgi:2-haloacid dehalogenase